MTKNSKTNQTPVIRRKLTPEQQKMVEDNHSLIYSFMKSHQLRDDAMDDWYGVCAIGLCQAALAWSPAKGVTFATFAYRCMQNCVRQQKRRTKHDIQTISLDSTKCYSSESCDFEDTLYDNLDTGIDVSEVVVTESALRHGLSKMSDDELRVIDLWVQGRTVRETAELVGRSHTTVSGIRMKFMRYVKEGVVSGD